jgi:predicted dehydrogenase
MNERRNFIKKITAGTLGSLVLPSIVPSSVFGATSPANLINLGIIGTGRIARSRNIPGLLKMDQARIVAACDLDTNRLQDGKKMIEDHYSQKFNKPYQGVSIYKDYRELLNQKDIDAVVICTPDHWHAKIAIDAVYSGKDVYLEKPMSLTIEEGRQISDAVNKTGRIFQIGSQYRSTEAYRVGCELVRNGRIGELKTVDVRMPVDPSGGNPAPMPVPKNLDYDMWLGSTPEVYYTEDRVHPQVGYGRPGWLRCEQFGAGMITGWGAHLFDVAHWGMDTEYTGPVEIFSEAKFPAEGLWNVHGSFNSKMLYANGIVMTAGEESKEMPSGIMFKGTEGWLFIAVGGLPVTSSDPVATRLGKTLLASDVSILSTEIKANEIHLYESEDHHKNWLDSIRTRQRAASTAEIAHRTCTVCLLQHISMKLKRKLTWDPQQEQFLQDEEADSMIARVQRHPYETDTSVPISKGKE